VLDVVKGPDAELRSRAQETLRRLGPATPAAALFKELERVAKWNNVSL
jgi:hypothetical protein